ncbi:histidine kinase [Scytonema sp. NUACC26]|uniref:PAS domain-containing sensor histidine kinase n=1 Tax=Scytonema sp. NUACC26 TaxID=3140176 RepID=UPI0034DC767E
MLAECYPDTEYRALALKHIATASGKWQDFQTKVRSGCYVDTSWASIRLSNGMIINIGQDITERKQAEVASILEERNRIAREIHDTLAQVLTGVVVHMEAAKVVIPEDSKARTHITQAQSLARDGLTEARRSVLAIRPPILEQGSLSQTLTSLVNRLTVGTQLKTQCQIEEAPKDLPQQVENNLLRVAQEAIVNALRYAQANAIHVELTFESQAICLRVRDDGRGFQSKLESSKGFGLVGMRERIQGLGGKLFITSQPGEGTEILAVVPL